jgi:ADP-ribose pyrophosphatase
MGNEIHPERTLSTETCFKGSLITVRRDIVRLPNGKITKREIVEHPPVVAMLALDAAGQMLLVRQYRKPIERVLLEIPAGGVEPGEVTEDAVRREMREETGYEPGQIERLATIYPSPGYTNEVMYLYVVSNLHGDGKPTEPRDEIQVVRVPVDEAYQMVRNGDIVDAKSVVGILMLQSRSQQASH